MAKQTVYTEQALEHDLRQVCQSAVKRLSEALTYEGSEKSYGEKGRTATNVLNQHRALYSARNKRAEIVLSAAKAVGASGPAMRAAMVVIAPQVPELAEAAEASGGVMVRHRPALAGASNQGDAGVARGESATSTTAQAVAARKARRK